MCAFRWDRERLAESGYFYDEDFCRSADPDFLLPPHVEVLRQSLLDFSCAIRYQNKYGDTSTIPSLATIENLTPNKRVDPDLELAQSIRFSFGEKHNSGCYEPKWQKLFVDKFFDPLVHELSPSNASSRRDSRSKYYYDAVGTTADALWTLFTKNDDHDDESPVDDLETLRIPKPDYAFYFPIHHLSGGSRQPAIADPKHRQWHPNSKSTLVESFSWSLFDELFEFGLQPTPFRAFGKEPELEKLKCYPWLIVEFKREDMARLEEVCCQAANDSASAVKLNQIAARYAAKRGDEEQIPPIPVMTTIGPRVKVMRCIWEGDMTIIRDIVEFRLILENTHTWATRVYKPLLSFYIDQWRLVHCENRVDSSNAVLSRRQETIDLCQRVVPMVENILRNHSSIEIDDSQFSKVTPLLMGLLVQQICSAERENLAERMDQMLTQKLEALTFNSGEVRSKSSPRGSQHRAVISDEQSSVRRIRQTINYTIPEEDDCEDTDDLEDSEHSTDEESSVNSEASNHNLSETIISNVSSPPRRMTRLQARMSRSPESSPQPRSIEETTMSPAEYSSPSTPFVLDSSAATLTPNTRTGKTTPPSPGTRDRATTPVDSQDRNRHEGLGQYFTEPRPKNPWKHLNLSRKVVFESMEIDSEHLTSSTRARITRGESDRASPSESRNADQKPKHVALNLDDPRTPPGKLIRPPNSQTNEELESGPSQAGRRLDLELAAPLQASHPIVKRGRLRRQQREQE
ncbi:hypothetical protein FSARC_13889 [Fusarium sarcochroum]|uniref:Uncharacterized protein n=1 Tax=Fusarium sarcochroum TaxID=1208366 RepID=A0A8H4SY14_9HYPO|nr:hypothetical protein FSARC_13889 [Fusarium sarcochroum]